MWVTCRSGDHPGHLVRYAMSAHRVCLEFRVRFIRRAFGRRRSGRAGPRKGMMDQKKQPSLLPTTKRCQTADDLMFTRPPIVKA